jgi:N-acetylglucosamine-6-sulfatase
LTTARGKLRDDPEAARLPAIAAALLALAVAVAAPLLLDEGRAAAGTGSKPNIIVIETDDQTLESFRQEVMPNTIKLLGTGGTTFTNAVVTTPLCCPSRVTLLTGQYGHNNGVLSNRPGYAGLTGRGSVLPTWLRNAGYVTAHLGKWLHGYENSVKPKKKVAPGWDEWYTALEPRAYYDYKLMVNGEAENFEDDERDHLTGVLNRTALELIREYVPKRKPLYLQLDQYAPHSGPGSTTSRCEQGAVPGPRDEALFRGEPVPKPPSFNEEDVSDKPSFIKGQSSLDGEAISNVERRYGCTLASLATVDRGVKKIWGALGRTGERDNTVIVFTSDNGFFFGEHRLPKSKFRVYEEAIRVPLVIHVPEPLLGTSAVPRSDAPVANTDITATLLELAGAEPCSSKGDCRVLDGRSLLDPMAGQSAGFPQDRAFVIEFTEKGVPSELTASCSFTAIRTTQDVYVEHTSVPEAGGGQCRPADEKEHYDLVNDPFQLQNLFPAPQGSPEQATQQALAARLDQLRDCAGIEGRDPQPQGGFYCE